MWSADDCRVCLKSDAKSRAFYFPTKGDGTFCFCRHQYLHRYIGIYVCKQVPGANSSPIITKLCQSYPWPQGTRWLNFGRSKVNVGGWDIHSTECLHSLNLWLTWDTLACKQTVLLNVQFTYLINYRHQLDWTVGIEHVMQIEWVVWWHFYVYTLMALSD